MELAPPFVVVAATHPSLDDAVRHFCDALRAETRTGSGDRGASSPSAALIRRLEAPGPAMALAALLDGEIIGLARIDSVPLGPDLLVAVAPRWRSRGVATALGQAIVSRAHAAGVPRIVLRTGGRGSELRQLAQTLGFQVFDLGRGRLDLVRSLTPAVRSA
jgi:GNAT superfamily N-acetyltransferase